MVLIKGINKTCLIDYEPYTCCVVFLGGCNFRCGYCHNPDLVLNFLNMPTIPEEEIFSLLDERKKWLDGVVITGGEPTMQKDLPNFIAKIKEKGYLVKLDTNGTNPEMVQELLDKKLIDYVAMDMKTDFEEYSNVTGVNANLNRIRESIAAIKKSGIDYEFRTTVIPGLVGKENIIQIGKILKGSKKYVIQNFNPKNDMIENRFKNIRAYTKQEIEEMKESVKDCFDVVSVR